MKEGITPSFHHLNPRRTRN